MKRSYSTDQLMSVLDDLPAAVIVSALDTRELLYANRAARRFVKPEDESRPLTCYQAFGFQAPCPTCPVEKISKTELFTRELDSLTSEKIYQLSGKLIDWNGERAHIEYIRDISKRKQLEQELIETNEKMQDIINAIPGGVAIYEVSDIFKTVYYSEGVPALTGYTVEEYQETVKQDATDMIYQEDTALVIETARKAIQNHTTVDLEFRKLHRDGHIVWVHVQAKQTGEVNGHPLLQCVFHNISALKETQLQLSHLINSIPGGIASYRLEDGHFVMAFYSDGVMALTGYTREEYEQICHNDVFDILYETDRERVRTAALAAYESGEALDISYRIIHKNGYPIWVHLNGKRMGPLSKSALLYVVFTNISTDIRLFQILADEAADGIYVIDKTNYELLYANELEGLFTKGKDYIGQKCYRALHGKNAPCSFCTFGTHAPDGSEHAMPVDGTDRVYATRFRETDWNGIPVYVKCVRDITDEMNISREKELLEAYFETLAENLPGGIMVVRCESDETMTLEYLSDGFADMLHMSAAEAKQLYAHDIFADVHPEDVKTSRKKLYGFMRTQEKHCELIIRMRKGDGSYSWMKCVLSLLRTADGIKRLYAVYTDITNTIEEKEQLRQQYEDILMRHYRTMEPGTLILGHCNITKNRILEIQDATDSDLLKTFGTVREEFFTGMAGLVVDPKERRTFLDTYLNAPALAAFQKNAREQVMNCFMKFPQESMGRHVRIKVNLIDTPDTDDVTGILKVTDITEQTITDRILHQLSSTGHDYVIDLDLIHDTYSVLTFKKDACRLPEAHGCHSKRVSFMAGSVVVPKDQERYLNALRSQNILNRLENGSYTFTYSIIDENNDIRTKNMTVSAIDLRLGRVCLTCTDITASLREQQGLLGMLAYTSELMGFLDIGSDTFTMYTRKAVLENLPPRIIRNYSRSIDNFTGMFRSENGQDDVDHQFQVETMIQRLSKEPKGYDFVFTYLTEDDVCYKQINVLWGDENHRTICLVRADVTDVLRAERESKMALSKALDQAEEASRAKSAFLSSMSHDIRTPMNAIMGMTLLAKTHLEDSDKVSDYLNKISAASRHLLSLINDVLDMSKIEQAKISLNRVGISLPVLMEELSAMIAPQAQAAGLMFHSRMEAVTHKYLYGDPLRINQILINLLSNAIKFTPEGGTVELLLEEIAPVTDLSKARYRFTVSDTGIGMTEDFLKHVFDPFTRDDGAKRIEGTGLGLSIAKGLIDQMGGVISVESQINEGSAFRMELECEIAGKEAVHDPQKAQSPIVNTAMELSLTGKRFLVVEDNAINAEILCEILKLYGVKTTVRTDGSQAVEEFKNLPEGSYDAILMDIQMPKMNGYEATRAIRKLESDRNRRIPIIAMTANAFAEDVQASGEAGMDAHIAKPIDVEMLKKTLFRLLGP